MLLCHIHGHVNKTHWCHTYPMYVPQQSASFHGKHYVLLVHVGRKMDSYNRLTENILLFTHKNMTDTKFYYKRFSGRGLKIVHLSQLHKTCPWMVVSMETLILIGHEKCKRCAMIFSADGIYAMGPRIFLIIHGICWH